MPVNALIVLQAILVQLEAHLLIGLSVQLTSIALNDLLSQLTVLLLPILLLKQDLEASMNVLT